MVQTWNITIPELTGEEERKVYLYLPDSYHTEPNKRYPVLYMFDGHNVFFDSDATYGKCWGLKEYLDYTNTQLIVVGVECNHSPDFGRLKEYAPYSFKDPQFGYIPGWGETTMQWIIHTLKPDIDKNYRTLPDREHTMIAGSSMGGLMSLYALIQHNNVFSRAAALSPSIWANSKELMSLIRTAPLADDTILYMDYGIKEFQNHKGMKSVFTQAVSALHNRQVLLTSRIVPDGEHCEACWEKQLPFMIPVLLYNITKDKNGD